MEAHDGMRRIRAASASPLHARTAALLAVPALAAGCLLAATAPAAYAAPACPTAATVTADIGTVTSTAGNLTAPIADSLRYLENNFDSFSNALVEVAPAQSSGITDDTSSADQSMGNAISLYEKLCIPSPLYPIVPPICVGR
jgi:large exoprotein involved in heme utilization and adhesion